MVKSGMGSSSEVNSRCVQAGIETGIGLTNMQKLCIAFGLPFPLSHTAYNNMKFQTCYADEAMVSLQKAALNLKSIMKMKDSKCTDLDHYSDVFDVSVSIDGTWQKRYGHSSLLGVVFILSTETGEVLDYEVKSKAVLNVSQGSIKRVRATINGGNITKIFVKLITKALQRQWKRMRQ